MSTNINISVGDNKLLAQASLQQNASRQAQLEKEANKRLQNEAEINRVNALAAQGKDANGNPVTGTLTQAPQLERRPAANRFGNTSALLYFLQPPTPIVVTPGYGAFGYGPVLFSASKQKGPTKNSATGYEYNFFCSVPRQQGLPGNIQNFQAWKYIASGGPYGQSYILSPAFAYDPEVYGGSQVAFYSETIPRKLLKPSNRFTLEFDIYPNFDVSDSAYFIILDCALRTASDIFFMQYKVELSAPPLPANVDIFNVYYYNNTGQTGEIFPFLGRLPLTNNAWNRVAVTVNGNTNTLSLFVNGLLYANVEPSFSVFPTTPQSVISTSFSGIAYSNSYPDRKTVGMSAVKMSYKILYSETYTPAQL